jgi:hypothetical protein
MEESRRLGRRYQTAVSAALANDDSGRRSPITSRGRLEQRRIRRLVRRTA